jgi:hypothetical protein
MGKSSSNPIIHYRIDAGLMQGLYFDAITCVAGIFNNGSSIFGEDDVTLCADLVSSNVQ